MEQSERIKQVLEVLDGIRAAVPASLDALATARKTATKAAANRRGIDERTIADKCWRGLWREKDEKFHIAEFDALAWDWLNGAPDELRARCVDASTNDADRAAVTDFFEGVSKVTRYRIRGDCEVWVEPWNSGASIVVNSVGGGPDRRPGLAALLAALARVDMNPSEVGYHPSRRDYCSNKQISIDSIALPPGYSNLGSNSGATSTRMLLLTRGVRSMSPAASSATTIAWTEGAVTLK